jgi:hypothetical protein
LGRWFFQHSKALAGYLRKRWKSKGESTVIINEDSGDDFGFTAVVSKTGKIKDLSITPGSER